MFKKYMLLAIGLLCATNGATLKSEFSPAEKALAISVGLGAAVSFCFWMCKTIEACEQFGTKNVLTGSSNVTRLCLDAATIGLVLVCLRKSGLKIDMDLAAFKQKYGSGAKI